MKQWMAALLFGVALISAAPNADARGGLGPDAGFHAMSIGHGPGFRIAPVPHDMHHDSAGLRDRFLLSGPMVPCSDYNPWVSVPPYRTTCD
jgi:hypothetical protein